MSPTVPGSRHVLWWCRDDYRYITRRQWWVRPETETRRNVFQNRDIMPDLHRVKSNSTKISMDKNGNPVNREGPRWHHPEGDTRLKKIVAGFRKNTGQTTSKGGICQKGGSDGDTAKQRSSLYRGRWLKKVVSQF